MTNEARAAFESELEIFNEEVRTLGQYLGAFATINEQYNARAAVRVLMQETPWFWDATLTALRAGIYITLGRIFDNNTPHSVARLLKVAKSDVSIFAPSAVMARHRLKMTTSNPEEKQRSDSGAEVGLYQPDIEDFNKIQRDLRAQRKVFMQKHAEIRHKWFAHREHTKEQVSELFLQADIAGVQEIAAFLSSLQSALWNAYHNGSKLVTDPLRFQADSQIIVTSDAKKLFEKIAP